ncbi:MAG: DNA polymerase III subunit alpha [Clostridiales bacterium]|nr:DNA polymerase III subunit alpha [Clostridiales bacterium]
MDENKFEDLKSGLLDSLDEMLSAKTEAKEVADKPTATAEKKIEAKEEVKVVPSKEEKKEDKESVKTKKYDKPFVHLHVHSEYSLLDGLARITKGKKSPLLDACKELGMPGCALTDHGNMFGAYTFYKAANNRNLKPIIGCEFYTCEDMRKTESAERNHLVLLAKNDIGYRNLVKMDSLAYIDGYYYKPRIDLELLQQYSEGVICLSACLSGKIPRLLSIGDYEGAKAYAKRLKDMFAEGDFYIELQDHGLAEQRAIRDDLVRLSKELGVKLVATNDVHYVNREDNVAQDILIRINTGKTINDATGMEMGNDQFYLKSYEEMMEIFSWCPEAVTNTIEVMEKCNIKIEKEDLYPPYTPDDGSTPEQFLRKLAYKGLEEKYVTITDEIRERAEYELDIIIRTGFAEYYLIVWDFINYARSQQIPVGPGRGSGVGSIIAYAVGITNLDPLKYKLFFERFLNPERVSAPDFDIDFCMDRRGEVIEYVIRKYGKEKVCQILALGTLKAKGAIKDVARVYNVPLDIVNSTTKLIPNAPKVTLDKVLGRDPSTKEDDLKLRNPEVIEIYENNAEMRKVIDMALKIEGLPRNCSKHAAGVVICKEVISDHVPLQRNGPDITTQFQKEEVEELGMLKMDFLGLTTLTDIDKALKYVKQNHGVDIDFDKLGYDDPEVYKLIGTGETEAVFQLESAGMKGFLKGYQPRNLEEVIAGISLYRPGPMSYIPEYLRSRANPASIVYDAPQLEKILDVTFGVFVYQEQVMQAVQACAGYTLGRADNLRRAMGKKKEDVMKAEKAVFVNGCEAVEEKRNDAGVVIKKGAPAVEGAVKRGIPQDKAEKIFDKMADFAKYAFNKSHAAAYATLTYQTAYLKRYYMLELFAAVINNRITKSDEIAKYLAYVKNYDKKIYPPDINKSDVIFTVENNDGLRFGLGGIKNVGEAAMQALVEERRANGEYKSIGDILRRLPAGTVNKKMLESLIKAGAFDCFGHTRAALIASYESIVLLSVHDKKMQANGQMSLFGLLEEDVDDANDDVPYLKEFPDKQFLALEKEVLNVYVTGHPLDEYREEFKQFDFNTSRLSDLAAKNLDEDELEESDLQLIAQYENKEVVFGCMLSKIEKKTTKNGGIMAYTTLEDLYGEMEGVLFPKTYERNRNLLINDNIVTVRGTIKRNNGKLNLNVFDIQPWHKSEQEQGEEKKSENSKVVSGKKVFIKIDDKITYRRVLEVIELFPGMDSVIFKMFDSDKPQLYCKGVNSKENFVNQIKAIVGVGNIVVK